MKLFLSAVVLIAASYCFVSCTKTNNVKTTVYDTTTIVTKDTVFINQPKNPIIGFWVGTYKFDVNPGLGELYYSFSIFADNTMVVSGTNTNGQMDSGKGTWTLSADSTFTGIVQPIATSQGSWTQKLTAKYSAKGTLTNGIWQFTAGQTGTGTFSLKRAGDQ